ncbi:hypothetical protein [uncultured Lacinutrix sp.]|uniref:hypothetical protein n=1 Tax=uncultured Lacinutrix sp. TaxID=574032 RepID=UPI0026069EA8|nr:hypothetical protein [uncultured Lacinutrix sp.]
MIKETLQLTHKIAQLEAATLSQECNGCSLKRNYITREYNDLRTKYESIESLLKSNFIQPNGYNIAEIKRSISILGLYVLV